MIKFKVDEKTKDSWQMREIKAGIKEAEAGCLVEHKEIKKIWASRAVSLSIPKS